MSIGKARSELQAAMFGSTGRQWCYTPAVTAVLAALEEAEERIAELKSQVIAQAPVLPEDVPIELRDEIIDLCNGYEIGDVGAQEIWEACRAAAFNQTHVKQPASNGGQSFGNSEQLNYPVTPDGWVAEAERLAELHGLSFVIFRPGEQPRCSDPTKVVISFTDKGLGHQPAEQKQEPNQ